MSFFHQVNPMCFRLEETHLISIRSGIRWEGKLYPYLSQFWLTLVPNAKWNREASVPYPIDQQFGVIYLNSNNTVYMRTCVYLNSQHIITMNWKELPLPPFQLHALVAPPKDFLGYEEHANLIAAQKSLAIPLSGYY